MNAEIVIVKLLAAHLVGDFLTQPKRLVDNKNRYRWRSGFLVLHALIHCGLMFLFLWDVHAWLPILLITCSHYIIDGIKVSFQTRTSEAKWFFGDQLTHIGIIVFIGWYFWPVGLSSLSMVDQVWIYATSLIFVTMPASVIIHYGMRRWAHEMETDKNGSLDNAGLFIGILERLMIITAIFTNNWQVIGFLLAAKSVFRFGDLSNANNRKLTEYVLIGTLYSFVLAIATGMAAQAVLSAAG
ncbi:MAG: DUF3307 domain-containing protein [Balneolaceae bacterium]